MNEQLNIALVGAAGRVAAPTHLNALSGIVGANLYALCDADATRLEQVGGEAGDVRLFTSYEDLLADPAVDAVDLVTPPFLHAEQTLAAAAAGKHVYCEKPMAHSVVDGESMVAAMRSADRMLMVGESYVFHEPHVRARALIDRGEIGDVVHVRQTKGPWLMREAERARLGGDHADVARWRVDSKLSGGGEFPWIMDHAPHFFATARYLAGGRDIDRVSAFPARFGDSGRSINSVSWSYEGGGVDGAWSQLDVGVDGSDVIGFRTEVYGTRGMIRVFGEGGGAAPGFSQPPAVTLYARGRARVTAIEGNEDRVWVSNNCYYDCAHAAALKDWVAAILQDSPLRYDGSEGVKDLAATIATIKSAYDDAPVLLADVPSEWTAY